MSEQKPDYERIAWLEWELGFRDAPPVKPGEVAIYRSDGLPRAVVVSADSPSPATEADMRRQFPHLNWQ